MKIIILVVVLGFILAFFGRSINVNAQTKKDTTQPKKIEKTMDNNCPVACSKNCKKDPNSCKKVQHYLKNEKNNKTDTTKKKQKK